jgi:hypothetical protein
MRKLARARPGEIHAVIGTQAPDLALEVRALLQEAAGFVDKSVPDIDIGDAGLGRRICAFSRSPMDHWQPMMARPAMQSASLEARMAIDCCRKEPACYPCGSQKWQAAAFEIEVLLQVAWKKPQPPDGGSIHHLPSGRTLGQLL